MGSASSPRQAFTICLVAMVALFAAEALYLILIEQTLRLWATPLFIGASAIPSLLLAWLLTRSHRAWQKLLAPSLSKLTLTSWLLSAGLIAPFGVAAAAATNMTLTRTIATPWMAATAAALTSAVLIAAALLMTGALQPPIERALQIIGAHRRLTWLTHPRFWLLSGAFLTIPTMIAAFIIAPDTAPLLPWAYLIGPSAAIGAATGAHALFQARPALLKPATRILSTTILALSTFAFIIPPTASTARRTLIDHPTLASQLYTQSTALLPASRQTFDLKHPDGCSSFAPNRQPQDAQPAPCLGTDLARFHSGPKTVDHPGRIKKHPHIILITTDALSFEHTTVGGYERDTTPNLAAWAKHATVFEDAFSNSTSTRLAMPGLLAGKMNSQLKLKDGRANPFHYDDDEVTLATILKNAGYRTVHLPGTGYFVDRWGGYWNGFDEVDTETFREAADKHHTSPELTDRAIQIIKEHDEETPLHLWIHYYDHHEPYIFPKGAKRFGSGSTKKDRYDSELHFADQSWGRLLQAIKDRWETDEYLIIFTSDHGEAFDKNHPRQHHDFSVFTRPLSIPLIIQGPWNMGRGARIQGLTGHIDVVPTIANLIGHPPHDEWLGESLLPALVQRQEPQKTAIYSLFYIPEAAKRTEHRFQMIGVRTRDWYYFENRRRDDRRLLRWREDPLDENNLELEEPQLFELYQFLAANKLRWLLEHEKGLTHTVKEFKSPD